MGEYFLVLNNTVVIYSCSRRLGSKRRHSQESAEEGEEEMDVDVDPLLTLVKRPRGMHADREGEEEEEEEEEEEGRRGGTSGRDNAGGESGGADLRRLLKKKRKRRDLKMRLGSYPRLVEEHR